MRDGGLIAISDGCGNLVGGILSYKGQKEYVLLVDGVGSACILGGEACVKP